MNVCIVAYLWMSELLKNQFKLVKCDKIQSKNQSRFLGIPGVPFGRLLGSFEVPWEPLELLLGTLSGSFGDPWGSLWAPLSVLGVCFADPWDPWGLLGRSRDDFAIFLGNDGSSSGSILASSWDVFSSFWKRRLFH